MQSSAESHRLQVGHLCASIRDIVEEYLNSHQTTEEPDLEHLRFEIHVLHKYLELIEKVRSAGAHRSELEKGHLRDVDRLLFRCYRTLSALEYSLTGGIDQGSTADGQANLRNLHGFTFAIERVHISFYKRTVEMSLMSISL